MRIDYLGPRGTYSEKAARELVLRLDAGLSEGPYAKLLARASLEAVAKNVALGGSEYGVMAYYNQLEGLVQECLDLIYENKIYVIGSHRLPITLSIGANKGNRDHSQVLSHPKALAQCSNYLWQNFPKTRQIAVPSTAYAAKQVMKTGVGLAICDASTLESYGLEVIAADIGNKRYGKINFTDFYFVSKYNWSILSHESKRNTMIAITPHYDRPGLLRDIAEVIAEAGINISNIHSRPALDDVPVGDIEPQMFYLEMQTNQNQTTFKRCIDVLKIKLAVPRKDVEIVRVLGSYERHTLPVLTNR